MTFTRFVEVGRVCFINYGPNYGKLCTIVDILDENKVLVEGPISLTGVKRQVLPLKRLYLTKLTMSIPRGASVSAVQAAWNNEKIQEKWEESAWAKKLAKRAAKASMNDFQRFSAMIEKRKARAVKA